MVAPMALLVICFVTLLILGVFVLTRNPRKGVNRLFFLLCISLSLWVLSNILVHTVRPLDWIEWAGRLAFLTGVWPFPLVLIFFLTFPTTHRVLKRSASWFAVLTPPLLLSFLCLTDSIQKGVDLSLGRASPLYGPLHSVYASVLSTYTIVCLAVPFLRLRQTCDPLHKTQILLLIAGLGTLGIGALLLQLIFPAIVGTRPLPGVAPSLATVFVGFAAYAIGRYRFLDITVVARRVLMATCDFLIAGIFLFLVISFVLQSSAEPAQSHFIGWSVMAAGVGGLLLPILSSLIRKKLDDLVFRDYYLHQADLLSLAKKIATTYDLAVLREAVTTELPRVMNSTHCQLYVLPDKKSFESLAPEQRTACDFFSSIESIEPDIKIDYELKARLSSEAYEPFRRNFELLKACAVVPLRDKAGLIGFLVLGEKQNGDAFSVHEIQFLGNLAGQLAVAIRNSCLYQELANMKEYVETAIQEMTCGVITVDTELNVITLNSTAKKLLGVEGTICKGVPLGSISPVLENTLRFTLSSLTPLRGLEISPGEHGRVATTFSVSTTPLASPDGEIIGVLAVLTDLTEIRQLEAEVRRVERLATVGTLAAGIAHEIKNPLVSLNTFAQLLPQKYDDPEFRTSFSQIASAEIQRIDSLVEQLLRFARPPKPISIPIDIHQPLENTLSLLITELAKKNISVSKHYYNGPLMVHGDSEQLTQVFMNILLNAMEALTPRGGGLVEIKTQKRRRWRALSELTMQPPPEGYRFGEDEVILRIEDNGPGIREAHLKYVFDPFFTTKETGHGLGLSIAHGIVREHGGSITAENRPEGGAAFTITLPLLESLEGKQLGEHHELRADSVA